MPSDLDVLRTAPLPDSFERTADWLRQAPPPRSGPARPILLAVALMAVVGACAVPVSTEAVVGYVVEATTDDPNGLVDALDAAVRATDRVSVDVESSGDSAAVRYVVLDVQASERARRVAERQGSSVRVTPLDAPVRQSAAAAAARWLGVSASPRVSDADLQAALDRAFAGRRAPIVRRDAQGRRAIDLNEHFRIDRLDPETRISRKGDATAISGGDLSGLVVGDVPLGKLLGVILNDQQRAALVDSLRANGSIRTLSLDSTQGLDSLRLRQSLDALFGDSTRTTFGDSTRMDSLRFFLRIPDE